MTDEIALCYEIEPMAPRRRISSADKNAMLARGEPFVVAPAEVAKCMAAYRTDPEILLACMIISGTLDTATVLRTEIQIANGIPITNGQLTAYFAFRRVWKEPTDAERAAVLQWAERLAPRRSLHWTAPA